jgi:DNA replication protein DnaC
MNFISCDKCINGWLIDEATEQAQKCQCLIKYHSAIERENLIAKANLPKLIDDYSWQSYIGPDKENNLKKLKQYIEKFSDWKKSVNLYCVGPNSCQKTTIITFMMTELLKTGITGYYVLMNDLIKDLTNVQYKPELQEKIDLYENSEILVIDESFDLTKSTIYSSGYQIGYIDNFLRNKEKKKMAIIYISNIDINNIDIKFGQSLKALVQRNCRGTVLKFVDSINLKNDFDVSTIWEE